jgi:hypothetical protein
MNPTTPPTQAGILPDEIDAALLERAATLPRALHVASRSFAAWRLLCANDFSERLRPRSISELSMRAGIGAARVAFLLDLLGWVHHPRRDTSHRQEWVPPLDEAFTPRVKVSAPADGKRAMPSLDALPKGGEKVFAALSQQHRVAAR